jgi:hypothetical protein
MTRKCRRCGNEIDKYGPSKVLCFECWEDEDALDRYADDPSDEE